MANREHLEILNQGVEAWNEWMQNASIRPDLGKPTFLSHVDITQAVLNHADLSEANLRAAYLGRANLHGAWLRNADLHEANLSEANLIEANLRWANLSGANLSGADLRLADLNYAKLREANLSGANLSGANLSGADLSQANLDSVSFGHTVFGDVNLSIVKALDSCLHLAPSFLDYHTLAKSGALPLNFLRNCGLSNDFITYLPSLLSQAIQYYSCFISYSTQDQEFAERIHADLQNKGVRCWFAPHDIQGGKKIHEQIDDAIRLHDRLLLILSKHSMNSNWVETEITKARKRELRETRRMLFPVRLVDFETLRDWECLDADTGRDLAREIREYFIPDFTNWKNHDSYQNAFDRLLRDLKPEKVEGKPK